ncbi:hypothetical protein FWF48_02925 [Candidatus Saccharibacteria bacterium]|nr:hypothetical protein [Candidatus Saccharibacteria bacterium]
MKIVISGSYKQISQLEKVANDLCQLGFETQAPVRSDYTVGDNERRRKLMDEHLSFIKNCDAFIVGNVKEPNEKYGRVGNSTYFETGCAYILGKPIFSLYGIDPESNFAEDLLALNVIVLDKNYKKLKLKESKKI